MAAPTVTAPPGTAPPRPGFFQRLGTGIREAYTDPHSPAYGRLVDLTILAVLASLLALVLQNHPEISRCRRPVRGGHLRC